MLGVAGETGGETGGETRGETRGEELVGAQTDAAGHLRLTWGDGVAARFHARWLRNACRCAACGDTRTGLRWMSFAELPRAPGLARSDLVARGARLAVVWDDGHESAFDAGWLRRWAYDLPETAAARRALPRLWRANLTEELASFPHAALREGGEAALFALLQALCDDGLVRLRGAPLRPEATAEIAARLGPLRETSYGRVQDLVSKPDPKVAGQTARAQVPHTDEPFRYSPPGVLLFHCLADAGGGAGASLMVDGFRIAEDLRAEAPDAFELLASHQIAFERHHPGEVALQAEARVFSRDATGRVCGVRFNDRCIGPQTWPFPVMPELLDALADLSRRVQDPANQARIALEPGDVLIFDNQRVLHGRTAFERSAGARHLRSCHLDRDGVHSRYRTLAARFAPAEADTVLPQGCTV